MLNTFSSLSNSSFGHSLLIFTLILFLTVQESIFPDISALNQYQQRYRELVKAENMRLINQHNQDEGHGFKLSPNQFLDLTNEEFISIYTTNVKASHIEQVQKNYSKSRGVSNSEDKKNISQASKDSTESKIKFEPSTCASVDIDLSVHASPVRDQGRCQSCYAHSSIATIQTLMHIDFGIKFDLSEQHITECTMNWAPKGYQFANNKGCEGGWGWKALAYVQYHGVTYQKDYPYTLGKNTTTKPCIQKEVTTERFGIKNLKKFEDYVWPESQCGILDEVLQEGKTIAVSIWVPAGHAFQFYGSETPDIDIWNICSDYKSVNHEVQLVGSTDRYWKIRNSFGVSWGENGYLYLDKSKTLNCLNVCMDFSYPTEVPNYITGV